MTSQPRSRNSESRGAPARKPVSAPPRWPGVRITLEVLVVVVGLAAVLWLLFRMKGILFLLFLAILFGYILAPLIELFRRPVHIRGRPRVLPLWGAIGLAYSLFFGATVGAVIFLLPVANVQLTDLTRRAPGDLARIQSELEAWKQVHARAFAGGIGTGIDRAMRSATTAGIAYVKTRLLPRVFVWLERLPWLLLVPIFSFFFIKDAELFRRAFLDELSGRRLRRQGAALFDDISRALAGYIRAQMLACAIVGAVCTAAFVLVGLPYAVILGAMAGLMEFIPLAGPAAIGLVCVGVAALRSHGLAFGVLAFLVLLRITQDYVVYPALVGREVRLHPLAVILAILCGGELAGIAGIFAAVPILTVLVVSYRHWKSEDRREVTRPESRVASTS